MTFLGIIYGCFCLIIGGLALIRGRNFFNWTGISLFLTPILGYVFLFLQTDLYKEKEDNKKHDELIKALKENDLTKIDDNTKACPYCAETIKKEAIYCRFCQKDLNKPIENPSE